MATLMDTTSGPPPARPVRALRRDPDRRLVAGVCAGIARYLGIDPLIVRLVFIGAATAGGAGFIAYGIGWLAIPEEAGSGERQRSRRGTRADIEVAVGSALLVASVLLTFRALGWWFSDAVVWPTVLVAAGGALIWRQSVGGGRAAAAPPPAVAAPAPSVPSGSGAGSEAVRDLARRGAGVVSRTGIGVALVIAAGIAFLQATGSLSAARDVILATLVLVVVLGVIFAPWALRLIRSLTAERAERIRAQERAEMAAHLHDSVLQTLALVQKRADDPREVMALARGQERELRSWLSGRVAASGEPARLAPALESTAEEVERDHGVPIDVVAVGDCELDTAMQGLVAAAREAMINAAKFGEGSPVAVYAEARPERVQVFIRDRGPGFDLDAVAPDRRGVRESILGRMARHGGRAAIHRPPDGGTEVELVLERSRA